MKKDNGFTLIELMIVVAIVGVLSAIAFPSYDSYMKKGRRADAKVGLSKISDRQERFYLQNNTYTNSFAASGLNTSDVSEEGYYKFTITSADLVNGFTATATAIAGQAQAKDVDCATLSLSSVGVETATAAAGGNPDKCW